MRRFSKDCSSVACRWVLQSKTFVFQILRSNRLEVYGSGVVDVCFLTPESVTWPVVEMPGRPVVAQARYGLTACLVILSEHVRNLIILKNRLGIFPSFYFITVLQKYMLDKKLQIYTPTEMVEFYYDPLYL